MSSPLIVVSCFCLILASLCVYQWAKSEKHATILEKYKKDLERQVDKKDHDFVAMQDSVIEGMATIVEYRDLNTGMHIKNTRFYVLLLARYLFEHKLHPAEIDTRFLSLIGNAAALHDIGKIAVSDRILNKPARLTTEEFEIMKTHTLVGAGLVRQVFGGNIDDDMLRMCVNVVQYHHEKWDGSGYPIGLSGTKIPICARIVAIADVFDAMVSKRIYKDSLPVDEVFELIKKDSGTHFDPELAEIFIKLKGDIVAYIDKNRSQIYGSKNAVDSEGDDRVHDLVELDDE